MEKDLSMPLYCRGIIRDWIPSNSNGLERISVPNSYEKNWIKLKEETNEPCIIEQSILSQTKIEIHLKLDCEKSKNIEPSYVK
jgi:hypothetical protein